MAEMISEKKTRIRLTEQQRLERPSFDDRVAQRAKELEQEARGLPPGPERDALLKRARRLDIASHINEWLSSPGLKAPE
jgi:hypothetical protein